MATMKDDLSDVLHLYGMNYDLVSSTMNGSMSNIWLVSSELGLAVLKEYSALFGSDDIDIIHDFTCFLIERRLATPNLITSKEGKSYVRRNGRYFALFEFVQGAAFVAENLKMIVQASELLAELHNLSAEYLPSRKRNWWTIATYHPEEYIERADSLLNPNDTFLAEPLNAIKQCWFLLRKYLALSNWYEENPKIMIHGDFRPPNVVFSANHAVVLDLDNCREEILEMDFARALRFFCGFPSDLRWKSKVDIFLSSYMSIGKTRPRDLAIIVCLLMQPMKEALWQLRHFFEERSSSNLTKLHQETDFIQSVLFHLREIEQYFANAL